MSVVVFDDIRRLLTQYSLKTESDTVANDLSCTLCGKLLVDAYQTYCGCQYCRECIASYVDGAAKYCRGSTADCREEYLVLENNVVRSVSPNRRVFRVKVHCPNKSCTVVCTLVELEDHLSVCTQQKMNCPYIVIGCEREGASKDQMQSHLNEDSMTHTQLLMETINNLRNEVGGFKEEISSLREEARLKEIAITRLEMRLEAAVEDQRRETTDLKGDLGELKSKSEQTANIVVNRDRMEVDELRRMIHGLDMGTNRAVPIGQLSFTVDNITERVNMGTDIAYSPYLYSHTNGYKLRLRVEPGGCDEGRGSHLSIFAVICRGEYDDVLPWPCRMSITITLLNQRTNKDYKTETYSYCTSFKECFNKPIDRDNSPRGKTIFIPHITLKSVDGLVVDDSIVLNISARTLSSNILSFTCRDFARRQSLNQKYFTPYFYSHANGYKLLVEIYPGGFTFGRGTHLAVFASICPGENDDKLEWPCRHAITISIVNQLTKEAYNTATYTYCTITERSFKKPIDKDNCGRGRNLVSNEDLQSIEGLIVDDAIIIHVAITPPQ